MTFVVKAESSPEVAQDKDLTKAKLKASSGLAHLDLSKYSAAARDFLSIGEELVGHQYGDVLSANDIAVYGGLCALASFSRAELKRLVLDNVGFRQYLELEPHIRDLIQGFYNSNYAQCLDIMEKWRVSKVAPVSYLSTCLLGFISHRVKVNNPLTSCPFDNDIE
jgi:COP9 signalosome complex subunit 1